nr:hypothetical protein [Tanacetum cinerariifolium]
MPRACLDPSLFIRLLLLLGAPDVDYCEASSKLRRAFTAMSFSCCTFSCERGLADGSLLVIVLMVSILGNAIAFEVPRMAPTYGKETVSLTVRIDPTIRLRRKSEEDDRELLEMGEVGVVLFGVGEGGEGGRP